MLAANRKGPMTCPTMLLVDRAGWGKPFRRTVQSDRACPAREYCCRAISLSVATWRGRLNMVRLSWYLPLKNLGCKHNGSDSALSSLRDAGCSKVLAEKHLTGSRMNLCDEKQSEIQTAHR